jgi:hypothetical protein
VSWTPTEDYVLTGYEVDASSTVFNPTWDIAVAISFDPSFIGVGSVLSRKTTIMRALGKSHIFGIVREKEFNHGWIMIRQNEPIHFLASCNVPDPAFLRGNFNIYMIPIEVRQ